MITERECLKLSKNTTVSDIRSETSVISDLRETKLERKRVE